MSEHGDEYQKRLVIDPIVVVGALLVTMFLLIFGRNVVRAIFTGDVVERGGNSAEIIPLPTAQPTNTPLAIALVEPVPSLTPTPTPLAASDAEMATLAPTATAEPTAQPTATSTPVPREPTDRDNLPATDEGISAETQFPAPTPIWPTPFPSSRDDIRVPILMYHYVSSPPADADKYRVDLSVLPSELKNQLEYLQANNYTAVTLYDLALALANKQTLPEKPIILTFDDGHLDNYHNAFPLLKAYGMVGTFFVITDLPDIEHPDYMSWPMIEEMAAAGMHIEIHTKSHRNMAERDEEFLVEEIAGSQEIIAFHTGTLPRFIAYPGGTYDDTTIEVVRDLDLWGALTTKHGYTHDYQDRYELRRVRIRNSTTVTFFSEWIEGDELE